jgi:hypothetical protein
MLIHDQGFYTKDRPNKKLDVVVVEASAITEDGGIIPGASVGASPELIQMADKVGFSAVLLGFSWKLTVHFLDHCRSQHCNSRYERPARYHHDPASSLSKTIFDHGP